MKFIKPDNWMEAHFFYICYNIGSVNDSRTAIMSADSRATVLKLMRKNKWAVTFFLEITEDEFNEFEQE